MDWNAIWEYFGNFNDREFFRIFVMACFVIGVPLTIGIAARTVGWSVKQIRYCQKLIDENSSADRVT
ncbi:hypothetical protein [Gimesia aquarii]|uniref:Uncharacterized protein n=1 Tax=Gimesia aquarii TaxID=2527964 RepID=A0A517WNY3_9PLAN|nr:hypothetical protein [Gimesia aquarii]QDU06971.1 hypothetical protein V202x_03160 [Gimesia aquarii]